jgi:hypothetical protein
VNDQSEIAIISEEKVEAPGTGRRRQTIKARVNEIPMPSSNGTILTFTISLAPFSSMQQRVVQVYPVNGYGLKFAFLK